MEVRNVPMSKCFLLEGVNEMKLHKVLWTFFFIVVLASCKNTTSIQCEEEILSNMIKFMEKTNIALITQMESI